MIYELYFHPLALKEWNKLDGTIKGQFKKILARRLQQPHIPAAALKGQLIYCYKIKLRQAGYRLVYQVNDNKLMVTVIAVEKRDKNFIYDKAEARKITIG
ncbi:MAG TPA: type II toxin-antitoxin system RelE/ParE family toxin [Coxiellaceae bacterium]|nr:type II toxin-antitoxin system RelE/ParE family toxin [Coxiellaceae bacterium]